MNTPRTVTVHHNVQLAAEQGELDLAAVYKAIGYLSSWAASSYPFVRIFYVGDGEFVANYYREDPETRPDNYPAPDYQIGAVYNYDAKTYSFHS